MFERILRWISDFWYGPRPPEISISDKGPRSGKWAAARAKHVKEEGNCAWCHTKYCLEVHHIHPFHERPDLELEDSNLVTLCELIGRNCHFKKGHFGNWKKCNPLIRQECDSRKKK
jgi:hypothetical protein